MRALAFTLLFGWFLSAAAAPRLDEPLVLVARPGVGGDAFGHTVIVVAPAGSGQHVGFIVNRPTRLTLGQLFPSDAPSQKVTDPVYWGGPVRPELVFALVQRSESPGGHSLEVMPGLYAAYEAPVVDRVIQSDPQHARFVAGLVAWRSGELQEEINVGAWIVLDADPALVMRSTDGLWEELVRRWQGRANSI